MNNDRLNEIYLSILNEGAHPDANFGQKFFGYVVKMLNKLKKQTDEEDNSSAKFMYVKFYEIVDRISEYYPEKSTLDMMLEDEPDKEFIFVGYYDTNPEKFAVLLSSLTETEDEDEIERYKNIAKESEGFHWVDNLTGKTVIGFNFTKYNQTIIFHEFFHMFQETFFINKFDEVDFYDEEAAQLGLMKERLRYVYDTNEFYAILFNDIYQGLQKIYWLKHKDKMSWPKFIDSEVASLKDNPMKVQDSSIQKEWLEMISNDPKTVQTDLIRILAALVALDKEDVFDDAISKLKKMSGRKK